MSGIVPRKTLYKKAATMTLVVGFLSAGLYLFSVQQDFLENFRWYHLRSYTIALGHATQGLEQSAASAAFALTQGETIRYTRQSSTPAESIPVLVYHGVVAEPDSNNITLRTFTDQLLALKEAGYETVTLDDFFAFLQGDKKLPKNSFLLTFDDGRKDSYYPVDPLLKALGYEAVIFVITKHSLGNGSETSSYYLSEAELKQMLKTGRWEIQSHGKDDHDFYAIDSGGTLGHFLSNRLYISDQDRLETFGEFDKRIFADLEASKRQLEQALGKPVRSFAYPFGDFGQASENFPGAETFVKNAAGTLYDMTFYQGWPGSGASFQYPKARTHMVKRIDVKPGWSGDDLVKLLERGRAKTLPYTDDFALDRGWIKTWGNAAIYRNTLVLRSDSTSTGASVFLDGTEHWRDYHFKAHVNWESGQTISLLGRFQDSENYVACIFSDAGVRIEERIQGERRIAATSTLEKLIEKSAFRPLMEMYENTVMCGIDGASLLSSTITSSSLNNGGIGFMVWDAKPNSSRIQIQMVAVQYSVGFETL